jgi:hypothetical protein
MLMLRRVLVVLAGVLAVGALVGVAPVFAGVSRFGEGGTAAGQFENPLGVAVDQESGGVYLVDSDNGRLEEWGGEGAFLWASGWGVADGHSEASQTCTILCFKGLGGAGGGQFRFAEGVAVDNDPLSASHGDVYVFDLGSLRVEKFDSAGDFLLAFGHEVNATTHTDVCLAGEACQEGTSGTGPGEFKPGEGDEIAVSPTGTVLVGDNERVQEFSPGGAFEGQIALPGVGRVSALAVDASGDVYIEGGEVSGVHKYDSAGVELGVPRDAAGNPHAITVGSGGELFVDDGFGAGRHILEYDAAGSEVASFDAGAASHPGGLAFGESIGELYVSSFGVVRLVAPPAAGPHLAVAGSDVASQLQPTTATLGAVLNPEGRETTYHFEYGASTSYGASTPPGTLEAGFEDVSVNAEVGGLSPRTTYHFRVVASNSAGTFFGPDETFVTLPPALIDSESVSRVTSNAAMLAAQINPLGRDTTYRFEYGSTPAYGASVPVPDGDAGSGTVDVALSAPVEGLSADTVYHYRVVAVNSLGTVEGGDRVFRTQAAQMPGLLDGRAWEMVSPPDKHGATLEALSPGWGGLIQAAQGGGGLTYLATGPVDAEPAGNRSFMFTQVLSTRGPGGWVSRGIATPSEVPAWSPEFNGGEYKLFNGDLSAGLVEPNGETVLSSGAAKGTIYRREAGGGFTPMVLAAGLPAGIELTATGGLSMFQGASPDLGHIVLSSSVPLLPGVPNNGRFTLYEWSGGSLRVVSVLPNNKQAAEENIDAALGHKGFAVRHAVSDDGSRVTWADESGSGRHLYVRDVSLEKTVQVDVVEAGAQGGVSAPFFETASSDGSKVFFKDQSKLTRDATSRPGEPDLYMCEVGEAAGKPKCTLTDLTVDGNPGESADVKEVVLGAGEDGRYVYFVANGVLAAGATPGSCTGEPSAQAVCNLYVKDTVTGGTRLVARLSNEDHSDWESPAGGGSPIPSTVRVSPSGRYLAFMSQRSLTGYDNLDARSGQPDTEVFLYDASTERLVCASCNPSGARPSGVFDAGTYPGLLVDRFGSTNWAGHWLAGSILGWDVESQNGSRTWYQSHYLSDSGRLFFNAADALVPGDTNGLEDVYEYEPGGVGGCAGGSGCVGLVSSGTSSEESALLDASESGNDVFFLTAARLTGQDTDSALDVYDAHVCTGGSPCISSPSVGSPAPPCASGDGCRGLGSGQPGVFAAPSSSAVSGAGNLAPAPPGKPVAKSKRVSRAQKLASALRVCRKQPRGRRRVSCEARARRLYGKGATAKRAAGVGATRKGKG